MARKTRRISTLTPSAGPSLAVMRDVAPAIEGMGFLSDDGLHPGQQLFRAHERSDQGSRQLLNPGVDLRAHTRRIKSAERAIELADEVSGQRWHADVFEE